MAIYNLSEANLCPNLRNLASVCRSQVHAGVGGSLRPLPGNAANTGVTIITVIEKTQSSTHGNCDWVNCIG